MTTRFQPGTFQPTALIPWMLNLATRMAARSLNMPEPLVHSTGVLVFAHVQAVETKAFKNRAAKTLCPIRLLRQLRIWLR